MLVDLKLELSTLLYICRLFGTDEKQRDAEVYSMAANTEETGAYGEGFCIEDSEAL